MVSVGTTFTTSLCHVDPWNRTHKHAPDRGWPCLGGQSVVVVVGNYIVCSWIYEVCCASTCTLGFVTRVETKSPPCFAAASLRQISERVILSV